MLLPEISDAWRENQDSDYCSECFASITYNQCDPTVQNTGMAIASDSEGSYSFSSPSLIVDQFNNVEKTLATLEHNRWALDGGFSFVESTGTSCEAYASNSRSDALCDMGSLQVKLEWLTEQTNTYRGFNIEFSSTFDEYAKSFFIHFKDENDIIIDSLYVSNNNTPYYSAKRPQRGYKCAVDDMYPSGDYYITVDAVNYRMFADGAFDQGDYLWYNTNTISAGYVLCVRDGVEYRFSITEDSTSQPDSFVFTEGYIERDILFTGFKTIEITIEEWSHPETRAKISSVVIGSQYVYGEDGLSDFISYSHEIKSDPLSASMSTNEITFSIDNSTTAWNPENPSGAYQQMVAGQPVWVKYGYRIGSHVEWIPAGSLTLSEWSTDPNSYEASFTMTGQESDLATSNFQISTGYYSMYELARRAFLLSGVSTFKLDTVMSQCGTYYIYDSENPETCLDVIQKAANASTCVIIYDADGYINITHVDYLENNSTTEADANDYIIDQNIQYSYPTTEYLDDILSVTVDNTCSNPLAECVGTYSVDIDSSGEVQTVSNNFVDSSYDFQANMRCGVYHDGYYYFAGLGSSNLTVVNSGTYVAAFYPDALNSEAQVWNSVASTNSNYIVFVGDGVGSRISTSDLTKVESTGLSGENWTKVASDPLGSGLMLCVGDLGAIAYSEDYGATWSVMNKRARSINWSDICIIHDATRAYALVCGSDGSVARMDIPALFNSVTPDTIEDTLKITSIGDIELSGISASTASVVVTGNDASGLLVAYMTYDFLMWTKANVPASYNKSSFVEYTNYFGWVMCDEFVIYRGTSDGLLWSISYTYDSILYTSEKSRMIDLFGIDDTMFVLTTNGSTIDVEYGNANHFANQNISLVSSPYTNDMLGLISNLNGTFLIYSQDGKKFTKHLCSLSINSDQYPNQYICAGMLTSSAEYGYIIIVNDKLYETVDGSTVTFVENVLNTNTGTITGVVYYAPGNAYIISRSEGDTTPPTDIYRKPCGTPTAMYQLPDLTGNDNYVDGLYADEHGILLATLASGAHLSTSNPWLSWYSTPCSATGSYAIIPGSDYTWLICGSGYMYIGSWTGTKIVWTAVTTEGVTTNKVWSSGVYSKSKKCFYIFGEGDTIPCYTIYPETNTVSFIENTSTPFDGSSGGIWAGSVVSLGDTVLVTYTQNENGWFGRFYSDDVTSWGHIYTDDSGLVKLATWTKNLLSNRTEYSIDDFRIDPRLTAGAWIYLQTRFSSLQEPALITVNDVKISLSGGLHGSVTGRALRV